MKKEVIIACDFPEQQALYSFLDGFSEETLYLKVGMELFYAVGPDIVRQIKARGHKVFLDLKLHDIPNTVRRAMAVIAGLGADIVNIHALGTIEMMTAAIEGANTAVSPPKIIAVTQLTSTSRQQMNDELLISGDMTDVVKHYALNAKTAGLAGVVCSPLEAVAVKAVCSADFITVTPGIRFADSAADDQTRITTPQKARELLCDYIVVGRPIITAKSPIDAYRRCVAEFCG